MFKPVQSILELRALTKDFPSHRAVDGVSLSIAPGEFFSLVGPSGCGKTTTLRLIAGFDKPTSGEVILAGEHVAHLPPYKRNVSTVFQSYALFPHLTVEQNLAFGLQRRPGISRQVIREKVAEALKLVRLQGKEARLPNEISGGERQRVALARSLVLEPALLLLDEPLSALDAKLRRDMRLELKSLQRRTGIAFLFVTHDQDEALSLSDRVAIMNKGVLEQVGSPHDLYLQPASRFTAEFLGNVNWLGQVGVRPEVLRVSHEAPAEPWRSEPAVVTSFTFLGNCVHLGARLTKGPEWIVEMPQHESHFHPGEAVHVWWQVRDEFHLPEPAA